MDENKTNEAREGLQQWIKNNLRIIVSTIIVVVIAAGIYSYSKRTEPPSAPGEIAVQEEEEIIEMEEGAVSEEEEQVEEEVKEETEITKETKEEPQQVSEPESQETEDKFIEKAARGEGVTHLARRTLANHLEKNPDSSLTAEHKIYIEDYLRKHVSFSGRVYVGTTIEFSKDLVQEAINESKNLNENQLKNLEKYSALVPSLS